MKDLAGNLPAFAPKIEVKDLAGRIWREVQLPSPIFHVAFHAA